MIRTVICIELLRVCTKLTTNVEKEKEDFMCDIKTIKGRKSYIKIHKSLPNELYDEDINYWLNQQIGKCLSKDKNGREVVILATKSGERFVLKRSENESLWRHLRLVFFGQKPVGGAVRERNQRYAMNTQGISTENALVWGESKIGFMQRKSFMLVPMVEGELFEDYWGGATLRDKSVLINKYGFLIGEMHQKGFFQAVRFKDIIVNKDKQLVLIDRECSRPGREPFMWQRSSRCIVRGYRRSVRNSFKVDMSQELKEAFLSGIRDGLGPKKKFFQKIRSRVMNSL